MINTFWIIIRKGPKHNDVKEYYKQLQIQFNETLPAPEVIAFIADISANIANQDYLAAILVRWAKEWKVVDILQGETSTVNYSDNESISGVIICWHNIKVVTFPPQINKCKETITDNDGNLYHTVKIGNQVWMMENLKTQKYNDGTAIPQCPIAIKELYASKFLGIFLTTKPKLIPWKDLQTPAYCWYGNDIGKKDNFGALYNWHTINSGKLAPAGWHVPSHQEIYTLNNYLMTNGYSCDSSKPDEIGKSLAAQSDWKLFIGLSKASPIYYYITSLGNNLHKNNLSNFSALPAGWRTHEGAFVDFGSSCSWWCSDAWHFGLSGNHLHVSDNRLKSCGFSVRLLKD